MGLIDGIRTSWNALTVRGGAILPLPFDEWVSYFSFNHNTYDFITGLTQTNPGSREEDIVGAQGIISQAYKRNGVIFACMLARMLLFSEARFQFQALVKGRPGELFGTTELERLEKPGPNQTTGDLLARMMQDADIYGNWYGARRGGNRIRRMQPDWVTIILGSEADRSLDARDLDADVIGYVYHPGGRHSGIEPEVLFPNQVAHFAPIPDPDARFRGMSWITPIIREVMADSAATSHKLSFFENGATPNLVVERADAPDKTAFNEWVRMIEGGHRGLANAYKTLYLTSGATAKVVGSDLKQLDFKITQGAGETRIAAAAGVPPVVVGLSEGLQGSSLNAGNYGMARRRFADLTMRPLWRNAAGSLESLVTVPNGARLWYDDRDIPFLQEDVKDAAEILKVNASAMTSLVNGGWKPDDIVDAVMANDLSRLKGKHSGLYSVQLQPPGSTPVDSSLPAPDTTKPEAPPNA